MTVRLADQTLSDLTPTITGTSDAAPGTTVTVTIAGQTMTTPVQASGTWNATPTSVGAGTRTVGASVPDPAGNVGSAGQTLTIDPAPPAGSADALVADDPVADAPADAVWPDDTAPSVVNGPTEAPARLTVSIAAAFKVARGRALKVGFVVNSPGKVTLTVRRGTRVVATLRTTRRASGRGTLTWSARIKGRPAPRGT